MRVRVYLIKGKKKLTDIKLEQNIQDDYKRNSNWQ